MTTNPSPTKGSRGQLHEVRRVHPTAAADESGSEQKAIYATTVEGKPSQRAPSSVVQDTRSADLTEQAYTTSTVRVRVAQHLCPVLIVHKTDFAGGHVQISSISDRL